MIIQTKMNINGQDLIYTYSDEKKWILRDDGQKSWDDMIKADDPHTYEETDEVIGEVQDYEKAAKILLGLEV